MKVWVPTTITITPTLREYIKAKFLRGGSSHFWITDVLENEPPPEIEAEAVSLLATYGEFDIRLDDLE